MAMTPPEQWALDRRDIQPLPDLTGRVVVVCAHPDDETLGIAGVLQSLHAAGARLEVVVATDGEAAFPSLDAGGRRKLAARRRAELDEAMGRLGLGGVPTVWLGLPDSGLDRHELAATLRPHLAGADACLTLWPADPHPDHRAAGLAARDAAGASTEVWGFPVWTWPLESPESARLPWTRAARYQMAEAERRRKAHALDAFASQMGPGPHGEPPVVPPDVRAHFETGVEVLFRLPPDSTTPLGRFADLYRDHPDPWGTATRYYEQRKRQVTLACLPRERYRRALDAGCGTGLLAVGLAERCDRVVAFDGVEEAVAAARAATASLANVDVMECRLPEGLPPGPFDLVVFSEVLYYLDAASFSATLDATEVEVERGGDLVAVDWRPATSDAPRDGDEAHAQLLGRTGWEVMVEHREPAFVLHVLRRR